MRSRSRSRKGPRRFRPSVEPLEARWLPSTTFTVNSTGDGAFVVVTPDGGTLTSLRAAINEVNADPSDSAASPDTITFAIPTGDGGYNPATGLWTITPGSVLPTITQPVNISAFDQVNPVTHVVGAVVLNGSSVPDSASANGLTITGGNSDVEFLSVVSFHNGIVLQGAGNNQIGNLWLGLSLTSSGLRVCEEFGFWSWFCQGWRSAGDFPTTAA